MVEPGLAAVAGEGPADDNDRGLLDAGGLDHVGEGPAEDELVGLRVSVDDRDRAVGAALLNQLGGEVAGLGVAGGESASTRGAAKVASDSHDGLRSSAPGCGSGRGTA